MRGSKGDNMRGNKGDKVRDNKGDNPAGPADCC
jgi:hypothetical protein